MKPVGNQPTPSAGSVEVVRSGEYNVIAMAGKVFDAKVVANLSETRQD